MAEHHPESGVPDETWDDQSKAQYEALKAKLLAGLPDEPFWLGRPTVPIEQVMEVLDRLEREAAARGGDA